MKGVAQVGKPCTARMQDRSYWRAARDATQRALGPPDRKSSRGSDPAGDPGPPPLPLLLPLPLPNPGEASPRRWNLLTLAAEGVWVCKYVGMLCRI